MPTRDSDLERQIEELYRGELGRTQDPGELATEYENAQKYGIESIKRNLTERASNRPPSSGGGNDDDDDDGGGGGGGFARAAVNQSRNPQLDALMSQMISNQKAQAEREGREADEKAAWRNQVRGNIMDRYGKASAPVDENDPIISRARQVHDAASQRAFNTGREAMASRSATIGGGGAGASDAYLQSSSENLAKDNSAYSSNLMMDEQDKRRQEIMQLLNLGAGVLTADENRMLQQQLGTIDAEMKQLGLSTNAFLGGQGLQNQRDLGFAGLDLSRYGMDQQNTQFYDRMGADMGMQEALMNQMIMQQLLGGD